MGFADCRLSLQFLVADEWSTVSNAKRMTVLSLHVDRFTVLGCNTIAEALILEPTCNEKRKDYVILVDQNDDPVGVEEKMKAHRTGLLHRAFSIFIFNRNGSLLLQKRHPEKYHCGGLWSNTCCSHPRPGEDLSAAAHRRLREEMGFDCDLRYLESFIYKARFGNGLMEYELDHLYCGIYEGEMSCNHEEVSECRWTPVTELTEDFALSQHRYTPWLMPALRIVACLRGDKPTPPLT